MYSYSGYISSIAPSRRTMLTRHSSFFDMFLCGFMLHQKLHWMAWSGDDRRFFKFIVVSACCAVSLSGFQPCTSRVYCIPYTYWYCATVWLIRGFSIGLPSGRRR